MNVELPGGISDGVMQGSYATFIFVILASTIPAGLMFLYFRKLGWTT
jgi:hypothetical protein